MKLNVPIRIQMGKKRYTINLNQYRNWHYIVSNKIKKEYCDGLSGYLTGVVLETPITLTFTLYKASKARIDRANILSIVEKFFCDALVHYGCIEDDNDAFIAQTTYRTGGIDKENPRVVVEIKESKK